MGDCMYIHSHSAQKVNNLCVSFLIKIQLNKLTTAKILTFPSLYIYEVAVFVKQMFVCQSLPDS